MAEPTEREPPSVPEQRFPNEWERALYAAALGTALGLALSWMQRRSSAERRSGPP